MRAILSWAAVAVAIAVPIAAAAASPLLEWRQPVYIAAGFAGIVSLALLFLQPLLIAGYLPGLSPQLRRLIHRCTGGTLIAAILVHVAGLWITSPPDVVDALLFRSPTPFSAWGVIAMWALLATGLWALLRRRLRIRPRVWRIGHVCLALVIVTGSVVHALLIEGAMEMVSKAVLCALVVIATLMALAELRPRRYRSSSR